MDVPMSMEWWSQNPAIVDLDAAEADIPDSRICPVCKAGGGEFPSYGSMLRHWRENHRRKEPFGSPSQMANAVPNWLNYNPVTLDINVQDEETIDHWVTLQEGHEQDSENLWLTMNLPK
jgi:hypothetical protein